MQPGEERLRAFQTRLGYQFRDQRLLIQALTHRTWLKEQQDLGRHRGDQDQQRLEFLGDAFLGYAIGRRLFEQDPGANEGTLTDRRARWVEGAWLSQVGARLEVDSVVLLGRGEEAERGRNERLRKDTVEALIGAVLLDGGESAALALVGRLMPAEVALEAANDPIILFNEAYQSRFRTTPPEPEYERAGQDHLPMWCAVLESMDGTRVTGLGPSKKEAKREACRAALARLGVRSA